MAVVMLQVESVMMESPYPGRALTASRPVRVMFLHYADTDISVKEMCRFRQIRRAGFVHEGESTLSSPLLH